MFLKLRFTTTINLVNGSTAGNYAFAGNSIYSPDAFSTPPTSQPYAYNQWEQFYSIYRVHGSKISVQCAQFPIQNDTRWVITLVPVKDNDIVDVETMREMPRRKTRPHVTQYGGIARLKHYASTCAIFGVAKGRARYDPAFEAKRNLDPVNKWYWWLRCDPWDPATTFAGAINVRAIIYLTYYVEFRGRTWLAKSQGPDE